MKTLISIYDKETDMTLQLIHFPKFDGPIEQYDPFIIKEEIDGDTRILHIDYAAFLRKKRENFLKHVAKNARMEFIDFSK